MAASIISTSSGDPRNFGNRRVQNEPLQRFTEAKKYMSDIFVDLGKYIDELGLFYDKLKNDDQKFVLEEQVHEVERLKDTIKTIKEMVGRDKMKVVLFGRTSNGKSSVVNAMLHSKILPQGMGHTTCCFIQVEGGMENEKFFVVEGSDEKNLITDLDKVGHAIVAKSNLNKSLGTNTLIRVIWPKSESKLLQSDVALVDSPGVDVSPEFDSWIDKHCLDADVFILVVHSEQTLTQAEKNFFSRVSKKLSKPNIFILCNRWDASASEIEESQQQIRAQHEQQFVQFLAKELNVCSAQEAQSRFYFISAREVLDSRLKAKGKITNAYQEDGFSRRLVDFEKFESNFEKCISKSAIRTKFEAHTRRASEIISNMRHNLDELYNSALHEKQRLSLEWRLKSKELDTCRENFKTFEKTFQQELRKIRTEVHLKVSADFSEEISRLESIFDRFSSDFSDDSASIDAYKAALGEYVEKIVAIDLENQLTGGLVNRIWSLESSMITYVREVIGENYAPELDKLWRYKPPFKFSISVNCSKLVQDFHEDLEFRFSLGVENMARWILSTTRGQPITSIEKNFLMIGGNANSRHQVLNTKKVQKQEIDVFVSNLLVSSATYLVNGSVGVAIAGLIIYKNVDWRWIASGASLMGGLYIYERWKWNAGAKEERLKKQFRNHLEQRLHQVESIHTGHCEAQVISELDQIYEGLKGVTASAHRDMKETIDRSTKGMQKIDDVVKNISTIKNKTEFVNSTLESFAVRFLTDSP